MEYNRFATSIAAVYETFSVSISALFLRARLQGAQMTPQSMLQMQVDAHRLHGEFIRSADTLTSDYLNTLVGGALTDPNATARGALLLRSLRNIAYDNINTLLVRVRGAGLKSTMDNPGGPLMQLLRRAEEKIDFKSKDSIGRLWESAKLVRFLARDFAYQMLIDAQAHRLAQQGDLAQVNYLDPYHENNGLVVSLSGAPGHPSLESVRDTIFHPNASAQLTGPVGVTHVQP